MRARRPGRALIDRERLRLLLASSSVAALLIGGGTSVAAAACAINDVGVAVTAVTNTAAHDCINVQNSTVTGNVTNTAAGTLTPGGLTPPTKTGITINNSSIGGAVSNAGTISATLGTGIVVTSHSTVVGAVINSGSIAAGLVGINAAVGTFGGGISNAGTISAGASGILASFVSSLAGGISNTGTITAGANAVGIHASTDLSFAGGISNGATGAIIGASEGVAVTQVSTFSGGISNAGTIQANSGIVVTGGNQFGGGITNSGTIAAFRHGILVGGLNGSPTTVISTFAGGISNSGTITAAGAAIEVGGSAGGTVTSIFVSNFSGGITNTGRLVAANGILVGGRASSGHVVTISTFSGGISNTGTIVASGNGILLGGTQIGTGVVTTSTFGGGISNSGTITAGNVGISVFNVGTLAGGIGNSASISAGNAGIDIETVASFAGGISNGGTISAGVNGINISGVSQFGSSNAGGITNSGVISASLAGMRVTGVTQFGSSSAGGISNSGTISTGPLGTGIIVANSPTFLDGIGNSGTITGGLIGIELNGGTTFTGGISNGATGTISENNIGIFATGISTFSGGISNNGKIFAHNTATGIIVFNISSFSGNINNSGMILGGGGIFVEQVTSFNGNISNTGTITGFDGISIQQGVGFAPGDGIVNSGTIAGSGFAIDLTAATSPVTIDQTGGLISGTIFLSANADVVNISGGTINGNIVGAGTRDTINFALGDRTFTYAAPFGFSNINQVNINSGTVILDGTNGASNIDVNGGTLGGTGTLDPLAVTIHPGGSFSPGTPGTPGTSMTIAGNLAFQSGALYVVYLNASTASFANVTGTATLGGTVRANVAGGLPSKKTYDILHAGGLNGTTFNAVIVPNFISTLSYTPTDVLLTLNAAALGLNSNLNVNQQNVANTLNNVFNTNGTLPSAFANVFNLTGAPLANALTQLDGEDATGAERSAFDLMNQFLGLMLDPFVYGRGGGNGATPALGFAPDQRASLPPDVALAYAGVLKAPVKPQTFDQRWTAWGAAFGGGATANGDPVIGSSNVTTSTFGYAGGMDYRYSPDTVFGFAIAGGGTNWNLAQGLGTGRSDALLAGVYGVTHSGPAYLAAALSFANNWFTTNRTAFGGDQLSAHFQGQSYAARLEGGYRFAVQVYHNAVGVTPYAAIQAQDFHTPSYSETDLSSGGFGLSYAAMSGTDTRSELGARFDDPTALGALPVLLRAKVAWAHDWVSNPALNASFESLPGSSFTVFGAPIPHDSALASAGGQLFFTPAWSLLAKFDGEFANGSQTYAGSGTLRYSW